MHFIIQCLRKKCSLTTISYVNYSRFLYGAKCGLGPKFDQKETIWNDKVVSGQVEGQAVATEHIVPFFSFLVQLYMYMIIFRYGPFIRYKLVIIYFSLDVLL